MRQKLLKLKRNLLIMIMINILQLQSLILQLLMFLMQDQHKQIQWQKQILTELSSLNRKIPENKTKQLLVENEFKKLKRLGSSYFIGKSHFEEHSTQNCLVFQPIKRYFKAIANALYIHHGNLKDYLTKLLSLIIVLLY